MDLMQVSVVVDEGGKSQALAISGTSAQSSAINSNYALVTVTTACFARQGANPTATSDGTDIYLAPDTTYRVNVTKGNKLAFKTSGATGTAYITPGA